MRKKINVALTLATLFISLLAVYGPVLRVNAVPSGTTNLAVTPKNSAVPDILGVEQPSGSFNVSVAVTNVLSLNAYDITLRFDENQMSYVRSFLPAPWTQLTLQKFPGSIREVAFITGGGSITTGNPVILVTHTFHANPVAGRSVISISPSQLASSGNLIAHTTTDGTFHSAATFLVTFNKVAPTSSAVIFPAQRSMDIQAFVHNDILGVDGTAFITIRLVSLSGTVFGIQSTAFRLTAGSDVTVDTIFPVDPVPDTFIGSAALFFTPDIGGGTRLTQTAPVASFIVVV